MALAVRVEVLGHDDRSIEVVGQGGDKPGECSYPACGGPDHDEVRKRVVRQCSSLPAALRVFSWCPRSLKNDPTGTGHQPCILQCYGRGRDRMTGVVECTMR